METVFKNGVSVKPGQVGPLPGLNYCLSLGPSMKSCFDIKPFPEVSCPGTADLADFASPVLLGIGQASCFFVEKGTFIS